MRKLVVALSVSTLGFAVSTAYLAIELRAMRKDQAQAQDSTPPASAPVPSAATSDAAVPQDSPAVDAATSPDWDVSTHESAETITNEFGATTAVKSTKHDAAAQAQEFLAKYADPVRRAELLDQRKNMMRGMQSGLASYLGLDSESYDRFVALLAQQQLASEEAYARCTLDKSCRYVGIGANLQQSQQREIAATFGPETVERYEYFQRSGNERQAVAELRGRLPDSARLSDAKADELVRAFVDETTLINADMSKVGHGIGLHNNFVYAVMEQDESGDRAAAAADYTRRLRDRAATVLTSEQLAVFEQMQQDALASFRSFEHIRSQQPAN